MMSKCQLHSVAHEETSENCNRSDTTLQVTHRLCGNSWLGEDTDCKGSGAGSIGGSEIRDHSQLWTLSWNVTLWAWSWVSCPFCGWVHTEELRITLRDSTLLCQRLHPNGHCLQVIETLDSHKSAFTSLNYRKNQYLSNQCMGHRLEI